MKILDTKKIKRRLKTATAERRAERKRALIRQNAKVNKAGRYRPVATGKDVYLRKGEKARLRRGQIAFLRID